MIKKFLQKIFKLISYSIFLIIYGKIENSINCSEDDRIKIEHANFNENLSYRIYKIQNGRMYTDRIHDTAVLIDNKIITEPSFQLRYTDESHIYNSNIKDNVVFEKGTPRKLIKLNGKVLSLLTGGGGNKNYWHWLFDVLPRLGLFSKVGNFNEVDFFLLPDNIKRFQKETLSNLNIPESKMISSVKFRHIKANELIVTDHPVVTTGKSTEDFLNIPIWVSEWLRDVFLEKKTSNTNSKIYIDRTEINLKKKPQRAIENEEEIKKYLQKKGFVAIKLHEINFKDQVNLFYNAKCIVGLHGGGFGNIVFCQPGTKIIELRNTTAGPIIENLAKKNKLSYEAIISKSKDINKFMTPNQQGSIYVPIQDLIKILEK